MEKILKSKYYSLIVAMIIFAFWLVCFFQYSTETGEASKYLVTFESIELTLIGLICAFLLMWYKNMFYVVPWITYTPFVFAHPFTPETIPYGLFIAGALLLVGIIIHMIRFKHKIRIGSFFLGLALLAVALVLGGINTKASFLKEQIIFTSIASSAALAIYVVLVSGVDVEFRNVAHLINNLGVLLCLQVIASIVNREEPLSVFADKLINVGWGISNNIAMMFLFTIPCGIYLAIKSKGLKVILYTFASFAQAVLIIITYSRGGIAALILGGSITLILSFIVAIKEGKKTFIPYFIAILLFIGMAFTALYLFINTQNAKLVPYAERFKELITAIDLTRFNGRDEIYRDYIEEYKHNIIFGKGLYAPFFIAESEYEYTWGHSTVIHTMYTMGTVGLVALSIHMIQKYLNLLIKPNLEKITIALCCFTSGLYGLVDVSYYFVNYMVVLIMCLICLEKTIRVSFDID